MKSYAARASLAATLGGSVLLLWSSLALSADDTKKDTSKKVSSQTTELEEVQVTGTRIRRTTDFTTAVPTTVIDVKTMENAGVVNVGDVLALTPSNVSNFTPATTGMSSFNTGAYVPDLRGLNPFFGSRTLTLIDSQRPVSTSTLDSFDLNMIPTALVERVDSVTGGGSASYGSGAVAGAINIILNHNLEGGRFDADTYATTGDNDARSNHFAFAYGHGFLDGRLHAVIGAEYQKQDPARCMTSSRDWCSANTGPYQISTVAASGYGTASTAIQTVGTGLTNNNNAYGVYVPAIFAPGFTFQYNTTATNFASSNPAGTGTQAFTGNANQFLGAGPGGDGTPVNQYANLMTSVKRKIVSGLFSFDITDNIKSTLDINYGKVNALNPLSNFQITTGTILGFDNPYLQTVTGLDAATLQANAQTAAAAAAAAGSTGFGVADSPGYALAKNWNDQVPDVQFNDTTLKQAQLGFQGTIPGSSWSWDAHALYGKTDNVQGSYHEPTVLEFSMALDATASGCRVDQGLTGLASGAYASALANYNGGGGGFFGFGARTGLPLWARLYGGTQTGIDVVSPVTGLTASQTLALFASRCQPVNPFGNGAAPANAVNYAFGPLSLALQQKVTSFNLNTSGDIFDGVGAGPFSLAVGYDYHKEVTRNDFASCPGARNTLGNANLTDAQRECLGIATDFAYQFGNDYGGSITFNEVYAELNFPLFKGVKGANLLGIDVAGRESWYENKADYGVNVVPGTKNTGSLATWKASLVYEPIEGIRFRGSQSHDSRAPNPRDLYYSQTFVPGGPFGGFCFASNFQSSSPVCFVNLVGNIDLKPETSNTTALGLVFTPPQVPGLEASVDWFHVKLKDAIQGGGLAGLFGCAGGGSCSSVTFNSYYYDPTDPAPGTPRGVSATPVAGWLTGEAAYRLNGVTNIIEDNEPAYNGGFTEENGFDISLSYATDLPDGSKLSVRSLTTLVTKQLVQNTKGGVVTNALNAIGGLGLFLPNFQAAAHMRGNVYVNWTKGNLNVTPNMSWIAPGKLSNTALACGAAEFADTSSLCNWLANGYYSGPNQTPEQLAASQAGYTLLPLGVKNRVGAYFLFGLNGSYDLTNIPGVKSLQLWGQINNVFDRPPPYVNQTTPGAALAFYDALGRAYRVGFRLKF